MDKFYSLIIVLILISSCNNSSFLSEYKPINKNKWHKDSIVIVDFNIKDTLSNNAVYINLRNNKDYNFNNIFLIVSVDYPNKTKVIDTLEYKMTNERGVFLGTGFTDIKENKLEFKDSTIFPTKGIYKFSIQQAMRINGNEDGVEYLEGITDVGIKIEKK